MPWHCETCDAPVPEDDRPCPTCGAEKAAWTIVGDSTRTFAISTKRFQVRQGASADPLPSSEEGQAALGRVDATEVRALPKARARDLADAGGMPESADVLFVELQPAPAAVRVTVEHERHEPAERELAPAPGASEVRLLCVHGPGGVEGIDFPGLLALDVADPDGQEHAPSIEVSAFRRPPRPVKVVASHSVVLVVQDELGQPLPDQRLTLLCPDGARAPGVTDAQGVVRWDDLELGPHHVAFEDEAFVADVPPFVDADGDGVPDAEEVAAEEELEGKVAAPPARGERFIEVLAQDDQGAPLAGARLVLLRPDGGRDARAADAQGIVRWEGLTDGAHHVAFEDDAWVVDVEPDLEPPVEADDEEQAAPFVDELEGHESPAAREPRDDHPGLRALLGGR